MRQVTVISPTPAAGRTVGALMLATTFGRLRGGYVLAWDVASDSVSGPSPLALRALGPSVDAASGDLARLTRYVRRLGDATCDVLAGDRPVADIDAGLDPDDPDAFAATRDVLERAYRLLVVDSGGDPEAATWHAALDASDLLVVTMSAAGASANAAARLLERLERVGRRRLVREAVTVVTAAPSRIRVDASQPGGSKPGSGQPDSNRGRGRHGLIASAIAARRAHGHTGRAAGGRDQLAAIERHFGARTRAVHVVPFDRAIGAGGPIGYDDVSAATRDAWSRIAADVADGL